MQLKTWQTTVPLETLGGCSSTLNHPLGVYSLEIMSHEPTSLGGDGGALLVA